MAGDRYNRSVRWIGGALAAMLIAAAVVFGFLYLRGVPVLHLRRGQEAPDFELAAVEGGPTRLRENLGPATVVVFMDTQWPEMGRYAQVIERFYRKHQRRGLRELGICLDESRDTARAFIHANALTFTVLHDHGGRATQAGWGRARAPESYLLDASGKVVETFPEAVNWLREDRQAPVERLLPSPLPGAW